MPKTETVERFKVTAEVGVADFGPAMVLLAQIPGLKVTGSELVTDVRAFGRRNIPEISGIEFLRTWIADHPTFRALDAVKHFEADGRSGSVTYPSMKALVKEGVLKKLGPGQYSRADIKHIEPPKKKKRVASEPRKQFDKRGEDVILTYARRNHGRLNTTKLIELFEKEGRARNSVYASINGLLQEKLVKRVGESGSGQYVLLTKSEKKKAAPKKAAPKPVVNGSALHIEDASHG